MQNNQEGVAMILVNSESGLDLLNAVSDSITLIKQDIKERFGQQHTDYEYPKYYKKSLEMLKDDKSALKDVINLYETDFDRFKRQIKNLIKRMLHL